MVAAEGEAEAWIDSQENGWRWKKCKKLKIEQEERKQEKSR
jgi:hypothetical protein